MLVWCRGTQLCGSFAGLMGMSPGFTALRWCHAAVSAPTALLPPSKVTSVTSASSWLKVRQVGVVLGVFNQTFLQCALRGKALPALQWFCIQKIPLGRSWSLTPRKHLSWKRSPAWLAHPEISNAVGWEVFQQNLREIGTAVPWSPQVTRELALPLIPQMGLSFGVPSAPLVKTSL